ncbi:hypothetical protein BR93DRAFT_688264 [Coniochaeta sp. PMI_546]|nr:hypothetical protein BR93DRAFT_688264 [Coniochaeta sp. PMI_546]
MKVILKTVPQNRLGSGQMDLSIYPKDCPGLEPGTYVHLVVEIMAPRDGRRLPRHPTPWLSVPEVGPWDVYADAAALAVRVVWRTTTGQWRSCALHKGLFVHRPSTVWKGVTSSKFGDEVNYMSCDWIRVMNFMGSLYQWEFKTSNSNTTAPAFLPLLKPYPGRVRTVTTDFFNQKFVISTANKIARSIPRLQSLEDNLSKLNRIDGPLIAIGFPPAKGWLPKTRTMCDMCHVYYGREMKTACQQENFQFGDDWGTTLQACSWCRQLRRYPGCQLSPRPRSIFPALSPPCISENC